MKTPPKVPDVNERHRLDGLPLDPFAPEHSEPMHLGATGIDATELPGAAVNANAPTPEGAETMGDAHKRRRHPRGTPPAVSPGPMLDETEAERRAREAEPAPEPDPSILAALAGDQVDESDGGRPTIKLIPGDLHVHVEQGIHALRADPDVYERGHELVHVTRATVEEQESTDGAIVAGTPKIHTMAAATLRVRLCKWAQWLRGHVVRGVEEWVPCEPTRSVVDGLHAAKSWPGLRGLKGIIEAPSLRPDGTVLDVPGWDPATGFLYAPSGKFRPVDAKPTKDDARRAYATLAALFDDFPYAIPAGQAMAVAAALTLLARPAIQGPTPVFLFDATTQGSGKTLQIDVCSGIATGREAGRQHFPFVTGRDHDSELSKVLASIARRGGALVNFDNLDATNGAFGGSVLAMLLTARDTYAFRILGRTEDLVVSWRTVVFGSGNNIDWNRDMDRRVLVARLESPYADPESRPRESYKHPELAGRLFEHVVAHRADLVHAGLTLLRAYHVAGKPLPLGFQPWGGGFESWSELVVGALRWVDAPDPMGCRPVAQGEESADKVQHRVLAQEWAAFCRDTSQGSTTAHSLLAYIYPKERGGQADPKWENLRGAIEHFAPPKPGLSPESAVLAKVLRGFKGAAVRTADAGPLQRFTAEGTTGGRVRWKVEDVPTRAVEGEAPPPVTA